MNDYPERDYYETDLSGEIEEERELRHIRRCEDLDWEQGIPAYDDED